jgi:hypothetical protein
MASLLPQPLQLVDVVEVYHVGHTLPDAAGGVALGEFLPFTAITDILKNRLLG